VIDTPDLAGFKAAMDAKRTAFGESVLFLFPEQRTYPAGTALNAEGEPLDPTVQPETNEQGEATVIATVAASTSLVRAGQRSEQSPVGRMEKGTVVVNCAIEDENTLTGAIEFIRMSNSERYTIIDTRRDGLGPEANRYLVTGKLAT
jgi:hypothetical protein